ncbi:DUF2231 domain-containing protein [Halalkalibaculum sp. DA3122]|uniref:DUF2231 domain-containing protein n=1 Tax=unclassified Halalkalibaculum TaxID=2964617 RepID=UPI0037548120
MNAAHYHLIVNHLPIFSTLFGLLILLWGIFRANPSIKNIAYILLVVGAISGYVAMETGESAEDIVEEQSIASHDLIHEHEEAAEIAFWFTIITGVLSLVCLFNPNLNPRYQKTLTGAILLSALIALGTLTYTAYEGGKISHPEAYGTQGQVGSLVTEYEYLSSMSRGDDLLQPGKQGRNNLNNT